MLTAAQTTQNISNFIVRKSSLQEITSLAIIRKISDSGVREIQFKIWSLPDNLGELTALLLFKLLWYRTRRKFKLLNFLMDSVLNLLCKGKIHGQQEKTYKYNFL